MKNRKYGDALKKETLKQARKFQRHRPRAKEEVALTPPAQEAAALDQWSCYFMGVKQALAEPFKEELLS